jgi:SNF2 family DNA or RNA helicase
MTINRFSSRKNSLVQSFLKERLQNAKSYKRIAGYFRSSIFELVGEEIEQINEVKIICNSELDYNDWLVSNEVKNILLKEKFNEISPETESLLYSEKYKKLYDLLIGKKIHIKVVPKEKMFIHGKAGILTFKDNSKSCFIGSVNESKSAFNYNYELIWEDTSEEAIKWTEEEFDALWEIGYDLPDLIIKEIKRISERQEIIWEVLKKNPTKIPSAILVESPIFRYADGLSPWQKSFVQIYLQHREQYGLARLLLADEVGLGKTLSLATAGMLSALITNKPVIIFCPSTLTIQWQVELKDKLGIPSAVWLTNNKEWLINEDKPVKTMGPEGILNCPHKIAIISTGLLIQQSEEINFLLSERKTYGMVILDEAHKARKDNEGKPNNLMKFMLDIAHKTDDIILGTATPIQLNIIELWDLLEILNTGAGFVLGDKTSEWQQKSNNNKDKKLEHILPYIIKNNGEYNSVSEIRKAWDLLRNPLMPNNEHDIYNQLRSSLDISPKKFICGESYSKIITKEPLIDSYIKNEVLKSDFFVFHNPIIKHTVLRRRDKLERDGLLPKIGVVIHPNKNTKYSNIVFDNNSLITNYDFEQAYIGIEKFIDTLVKRTKTKSKGLIRTMLFQRICSSFYSGKCTVERILNQSEIFSIEEDDGKEDLGKETIFSSLSTEEKEILYEVLIFLKNAKNDPKLKSVLTFLQEIKTEDKNWKEHGCIIFSQYYDTANFFAENIAKQFPEIPIGLYAGMGKSKWIKSDNSVNVKREDIKLAVKNKKIKILVATDAACEGLNLQTLGTLINIDLPWNPSKLEQRIGRIKRIGQIRKNVDVLNLIYQNTLDEKIYEVLSKRMEDKYNILGNIPDTINVDWFGDIKELEKEMDKYISQRKNISNPFEDKYQQNITLTEEDWNECSKVMSRSDLLQILSNGW